MADNARFAAFHVLQRFRKNSSWSSEIIDSESEKYKLDQRDTAFASRLSLSVLENINLCDFYVSNYSNIPINKIDPNILDVLRIGIVQFLFFKIPHSAIVDTSVELTKKIGKNKASGFVNAVLRSFSRNIENLPEIPIDDPVEYLEIKYSHPKWLINEIIERYGFDFTEDFLKENNNQQELAVQINTLKTDSTHVANLFDERELNWSRHPYDEDCFLLHGGGRVDLLPGYSDGLFYVQDEAAKMCVVVSEAGRTQRVLDACSAPGGKSFAAAIRMENCGEIVSTDIHSNKLRFIEEGSRRLGIEIIHPFTCDARDLKDNRMFDVVIADVPCSGFGVIRKKPEIRYKDPNDISRLPKIQLEILNNVSKLVKENGILMYSTCTVLMAENEDVIDSFLSENTDFVLDKFCVNGIQTDGLYTFWPHIDKTDGFFICKLRKQLKK